MPDPKESAMNTQRIAGLQVAVAVAVTLGCNAVAFANPFDISLRGLGQPYYDPSAQTRFRALTTELAFTMSPKPMQPAETLGMSGFEISISNGLTDITEKADYWEGQPGSPVFEAPLTGRQIPKMLWTPTLHVRKGLPMSTEFGVQATYLAFSELFSVGGEFKFALHESFISWLPAMSVRAAVSRLVGSNEVDIVTAEGDAMMSYAFGLGGMIQLTPYAGAGRLFVNVNSQVLDATPYVVVDPLDQRAGLNAGGGPEGSLYRFKSLSAIDNYHNRVFGGIRMNVAMIELLFEYNLGLIDFNKRRISSYGIKLGFDVSGPLSRLPPGPIHAESCRTCNHLDHRPYYLRRSPNTCGG